MNKYDEIGDQKGKAEYIREQLKIYPNDPALLTNLAHALQCWYFHSGKANTEALRKEKSDEIISLCERALKYYKPTENNSFPKQLLIIQYINYLHDKEKAKKIVESLSTISCSYEMFAGDLYEGKEALKERQRALLWSFTQMMYVMFRALYRDEAYSFEQRIEILDAYDAILNIMTGGKPNFFNEALSKNALSRAWCLIGLGENEKTLDMLEKAYEYADIFETRPDGEKYAPCWLSELEDSIENEGKTGMETNYNELYNCIMNPDYKFCETFAGNERFEQLVEKLKEKISK